MRILMRMKGYVVLALSLVSCVSGNSMGTLAESEQNVTNLSRIAPGMSESEVLCIMKRPYSQEVIQLNQDTYEVWFYVTTPTAMGQSRMVKINLTPVTFKNGELASVGYDYYKRLLKQQKAAVQENGSTQPQPSDENQSLEKVLEPTATSANVLSMSSKPKDDSAEDAKDKKSEEKKKPPLKESDGQMLEMEGEQNFDFW